MLHFILQDNLTYDVDPRLSRGFILAMGSEVRGFKPGRGRWIFFRA